MSRLLHAAARGARIGEYWRGAWIPADMNDVFVADFDFYRTHPDDEALQYGPISTALRKLSEYPPPLTRQLGDVARHYVNEYKHSDEMYMYENEFHRSLFLLILSEALADDGL